ncbi:MAG: ribose-5-phosphate isomerase RpiA [Pseudomonadota bacterium]
MPHSLSPADAGKAAAAMASVAQVTDGMVLGLGTGSTAVWMVRALAHKVAEEDLTLTCVATSDRTAALATHLGLMVVDLDDVGRLDLTIDGADEFDPQFRLIKGGGGAHLREKLVAAQSDRMVVITDPSKDVATLGAFPLPIEVIQMGHRATMDRISAELAAADVNERTMQLRQAGYGRFETDEGNYVVDVSLARIGDPEALAMALSDVPGVVEHGLFLGLADSIVIGHPDGRAETRTLGQDPEWTIVDMAAAEALPNA